MNDLNTNEQTFPKPYWINTSSNSIIKDMISRADRKTKIQIEALLDGGTLDIQAHEGLCLPLAFMTVLRIFIMVFWQVF